MTARGWSFSDIPDLTGRRALVTGVTSGLGEVTARELARAGAVVVLAARDPGRLDAARARLGAAVPDGRFEPLVLDLADLASVRRAAGRAVEQGPLHVLVNNAGVMAPPEQRTVDGFELQLGTNHLGPFALTGLLLPALAAAGDARVVTVSSLMARTARTAPTGDPREHRPYNPWTAYGESKLANLLFTFELDRRVRRAGLPVTAVAAHPGYTRTELVANGVGKASRRPVGRMVGSIAVAVTSLLGQDVETGAAPQLRAATEPGLPGGSYLGPGGPFEVRGAPRKVRPPAPAQDATAAAALWSMSESATGVSFP